MIPMGLTSDDVREVVVAKALVATRTVPSHAWAQSLIIHKLSTLVEKTHGPCSSVCERRPGNLSKDGPCRALTEFK